MVHVLIAKVWHWLWRDVPDREWKPTGLKPKPPGWERYDQEKGTAGRLKALRREATARKVADRYGRHAEVVDIHDAKAHRR